MTVNFLDKDVWTRVVKTFVAAFLAVWGVPAILGWLSGSQPIDTSTVRAAAVAGFAAVITLVWNLFLKWSDKPKDE